MDWRGNTRERLRLSKALAYADLKLERGDIRAFAPYLKILTALDRYHRVEGRALPLPTHIERVLSAPPLALPGPAPPDPGPAAEVADSGA